MTKRFDRHANGGKRDNFERYDLIALAHLAGIKKTRANETIDRVIESIRRWPDFAIKAGVTDVRMAKNPNPPAY